MFSLKYAQAAPDQRQAAFAELEELVRSLKELPKQFPTLPAGFYDKAKKELDAETPKVSVQQGAQAASGGPAA